MVVNPMPHQHFGDHTFMQQKSTITGHYSAKERI